MNIALGAVFIVILLLPPIAFSFSYTLGNDAKAKNKFSLIDGLLLTAIISLVIHSLAIFFINEVLDREIRFDILLKLVGGEIKDVENKIKNDEFESSLKEFAYYNFIINVIMALLGRMFREIAKRNAWGFDSDITRLKNNWWYFFYGYTLPNENEEGKDYDYIFLDALVDTVGGSMIYSGIMVGFICNGEELDRIYISDAERRELRKKTINEAGHPIVSEEPGDPFRIDGQMLSIAYSQIKNLNIRFIQLVNLSETEIEVAKAEESKK